MKDAYTATCPLGHSWPTPVHLAEVAGLRKPGGRRPKPHQKHIVTYPTCPQCGHRWSLLQPAKGR